MKYAISGIFIIHALLIGCSSLFSQECAVEKQSLKGSYTGDCKNGKASGKGKAIGSDTYEGEFKNGLPDGKGVYTWNNGDTYIGAFAKGRFEGEGIFRHKRSGNSDSTVEGFWKNDKYIGRYEKSYKIYAESERVVKVDVKFNRDAIHKVNIYVVNTSSSAKSFNNANGVKMKVDDLGISMGAYQRSESYEYMKRTETVLFKVDYPLHMKLRIGTEMIDMELFEEGSYTIDVNINN